MAATRKQMMDEALRAVTEMNGGVLPTLETLDPKTRELGALLIGTIVKAAQLQASDPNWQPPTDEELVARIKGDSAPETEHDKIQALKGG